MVSNVAAPVQFGEFSLKEDGGQPISSQRERVTQ